VRSGLPILIACRVNSNTHFLNSLGYIYPDKLGYIDSCLNDRQPNQIQHHKKKKEIKETWLPTFLKTNWQSWQVTGKSNEVTLIIGLGKVETAVRVNRDSLQSPILSGFSRRFLNIRFESHVLSAWQRSNECQHTNIIGSITWCLQCVP